MNNQDYQNYQSSLRALLNKALVEALKHNEAQTKTWKDYKKINEKVKQGLEILPQELTTNCMVPIGRKALMKGKLVHTNEILVCLGEGYFAKYTAKQAIAVCDRRIKQADEMLINLEKEQNLLEMRQSLPIDYGIFANDERQEIIEPYIEEEEKAWRLKHRQREKEYRQKLAKLRAQEKTEIQSEEDLWQRLDELELEEELEDEFNRLHEDDCDYHEENNENNDDSYEEENCEFSEEETSNGMIQEILVKLKNSMISKYQRDVMERKNFNEEAERKSSSPHNIPNSHQPSSSSSLDTNTFDIEFERETIDHVELECLLADTNDQKSTDIESTRNDITKLLEHDITHTCIGQSSETSDSTSEGGLTDVKFNESVEKSSQSETNVEGSVRFESQSKHNAVKLLLPTSERKMDKFSSRNCEEGGQVTKFETQKRRVSFTNKIRVNVLEKFARHSFDQPLKKEEESSSKSDGENETNKLKTITDKVFVGAELSSNNEQTTNSTENEDDEDDIIRIEFKHSKRRPRKSVRSFGDDKIENPSDIYRVFHKPKSILKKATSDVDHFQSIAPPADDVVDQENDELPFESSYTIIVKDVEERKPKVLDISPSSSKTRPPSRFKMARSGMNQ